MTEDEAKTKWCPHVRVKIHTGGGEPASNRMAGGALSRSVLCIGSECMAWRKTLPVSLSSINRAVTVQVPTGYCGLAGPVT